VAYAILAYGYVILTPIWQNPDEPAHYNYVAFVAETGGLPELKPGDWDSALLERVKNGTLQPGDRIEAIRYESWQPPLLYLLAAPVYRLGATDNPAQVLTRLRSLNVVFGAMTLVLAFGIARHLFEPGPAAAQGPLDPGPAAAQGPFEQALATAQGPLEPASPDAQGPFEPAPIATRRPLESGLAAMRAPLEPALAAAVPLAMVGVPMFVAVSAALSADSLANLLAAAILLALLQPPNGDLRWSIVVGVLLGLGLLTKLELAIFVPIAVGVVVTRSARRIRDCVIVLVTAGILIAPWLVHQVTTYGWIDPLALGRHAQVVADQPRFPGLSLEWLGQFLTVSFHSFWAQFGWMAIVAPVRLYAVWGVVAAVALVGVVLARQRLREPAWMLMLATVAVACVAYLGYNLAFEQFQARYVFTALTPIAALLVLGWSAILPKRSLPWGVFLMTLALIAINAYTLFRVLVPGFTLS
jgi:4-amino-4-deoxy-L-arabinose transferase-like glycosyltransferase